MVITLTAVSRNQWKKVGGVALWLAASVGCSALLALVTNHAALFGTTAPAFNLALVTLKQVFQDEEDQAIEGLPAPTKSEVQNLAQEAEDEANALITPTKPKTPARGAQNGPEDDLDPKEIA